MRAPYPTLPPEMVAWDHATGVDQIYKYQRLSDRIATAGQPTETELLFVKKAGFRTVLNLALSTSDNALEDEQAVVVHLGMDYVHIPVEFEAPRPEDYRRFVQAMQNALDGPVFVHCAANKRVSAFFWLYEMEFSGVSEPQATAALHRIWQPDRIWQSFLQNERKRFEREPSR